MPHNSLQSKLNAECSIMKFNKHNLGKRFSKFLSKMFWHFDQTVPNYTSINLRRTTSADKRPSDSRHQLKSMNNTNRDRTLYTKRIRKCSIRERTTTLMSIQEENEIELMNCK